ncbi:MAG: type II toxin-antitoxin system VapC family toxin [bacterium]
MRLLLDTCTFLWLTVDAPELPDRARGLIADPANELFLSAASSWEIAVKHALQRLPLPSPPERFVPQQREAHGIEDLAINEESTLHVGRLPALHRDPFDRILICQAIVHGLMILGPDPLIAQYPVRTTW